MLRVGCLALLLLVWPIGARAQDAAEPWTFGVSGAAGLPSSLGSVRVGAPLGPKVGIDLAVARLTGFAGTVTGPAYITQVRWMRRGRKSSGDSRYWIFGVLGMRATSSTLVIYPGDVRRYLVTDQTLIMPRFGYGWDHIARRGIRIGLELTTGAAGEEAGLMLANFFVMWGPPRS